MKEHKWTSSVIQVHTEAQRGMQVLAGAHIGIQMHTVARRGIQGQTWAYRGTQRNIEVHRVMQEEPSGAY